MVHSQRKETSGGRGNNRAQVQTSKMIHLLKGHVILVLAELASKTLFCHYSHVNYTLNTLIFFLFGQINKSVILISTHYGELIVSPLF